MSSPSPTPLIAVPANISTANDWGTPQHVTGEKYLRAVIEGSKGVPVVIPAFCGRMNFAAITGCIDGLLLTGGRANVEPHHYGGPEFPDDEIIDPARDATVLPLIRACIDQGIPVFGICRGIQEINVALGGSLHYRVHQVPGMNDHRMIHDDDIEVRFGLRHPVNLTPGGYLAGLVRQAEIMVNSLHGQGIDRPAPGLKTEAVSPDGVIEAVRLEGTEIFTVGVQWHAEYEFHNHALSCSLFTEFGNAAREHAKIKV